MNYSLVFAQHPLSSTYKNHPNMTPLKIFQSFDRLGDSGKSGVWQYEIIEIFQILQTHGVLPLGVRIMQILQVMEMLQKIPRLQRLQMIQMLMMYL